MNRGLSCSVWLIVTFPLCWNGLVTCLAATCHLKRGCTSEVLCVYSLWSTLKPLGEKARDVTQVLAIYQYHSHTYTSNHKGKFGYHHLSLPPIYPSLRGYELLVALHPVGRVYVELPSSLCGRGPSSSHPPIFFCYALSTMLGIILREVLCSLWLEVPEFVWFQMFLQGYNIEITQCHKKPLSNKPVCIEYGGRYCLWKEYCECQAFGTFVEMNNNFAKLFCS